MFFDHEMLIISNLLLTGIGCSLLHGIKTNRHWVSWHICKRNQTFTIQVGAQLTRAMKNSIKKTFNTINKCLSKLIYPQTLTYNSLPRMPKLQYVKVYLNTSHSCIEHHHKCITYILSVIKLWVTLNCTCIAHILTKRNSL